MQIQVRKLLSIHLLPWTILLVLAITSPSLHGQTIDESLYVQFESTSASIKPPPGFTFDKAADRWDGENASIQLEVMRGKPFTPRSDTFMTRPGNWRSIPKWGMDTMINGRRYQYNSATTSKMMGRPGAAVKLEKWEGLLRFGTKDVVYYLVAQSSDISPKRIEELQEVILTARFEGDLIAKAEVKSTIGKVPLFDLDLSDFPFGDQLGANNVYSYRDIGPVVEMLKIGEQERKDSIQRNGGIEKMLGLAMAVTTADFLTVTQYGEGTGDNLIALKHAVLLDADRLEDPLGIRGHCELSDRGSTRLGTHEALYSRYQCRGGAKAINGAIFAFSLGPNVFQLKYEVADWTSADIARLEQRLGTLKLK